MEAANSTVLVVIYDTRYRYIMYDVVYCTAALPIFVCVRLAMCVLPTCRLLGMVILLA
jgi:hypothetical protein